MHIAALKFGGFLQDAIIERAVQVDAKSRYPRSAACVGRRRPRPALAPSNSMSFRLAPPELERIADHMDYVLLTGVVWFEENKETLTFAFSADEEGSAKYLMFQYSLQTDEQDRNHQLDGLYIERDEQVFGCYHGVKSIRTIDDRIEIELSDTGKRRLQVERMVIIAAHWDTAIDQGLLRLAELSGGEYEVEVK